MPENLEAFDGGLLRQRGRGLYKSWSKTELDKDSLESVSDIGDDVHPLPQEVLSEFCAEGASNQK